MSTWQNVNWGDGTFTGDPGGTGGTGGSGGVPPPVITSFTGSVPSITVGGSADLSFSVTGADTISIDQGIGIVTSSPVTVSPATTTSYTITAVNAGGAVTATVIVLVRGASAENIRYHQV